MEIKRVGSQPSGKGPADWFTGTVRIDPLFQAPDPALVAGASVTFEPGARTAWHTHPLGQTLIVTAGCGWVQRDGGAIEESSPRRRRLVLARRETLARSHTHHGPDPHRNPGATRRQDRRLDGTRHRRTIPAVNPEEESLGLLPTNAFAATLLLFRILLIAARNHRSRKIHRGIFRQR